MFDVTIDEAFFNSNQNVHQVPRDDMRKDISIVDNPTAQKHTMLRNDLRIAPGENNAEELSLYLCN